MEVDVSELGEEWDGEGGKEWDWSKMGDIEAVQGGDGLIKGAEDG